MTAAATAKFLAKVSNRLTGTLGSTIDAAWALREEKRVAEAAVKVIEAKIEALEEALFERMDKEETTKSQGKHAAVSITTAVVANVQDWDTFHAYIKKSGHFHLLQKRCSDPAYRELLDLGKKVPGVEPFSKRRINLRSLTV
jgi:hypothetical protein